MSEITPGSRVRTFGDYELNRAGNATVWAIDPGTTHSGVVMMVGKEVRLAWSKIQNSELLEILERQTDFDDHLAIEMVASYGMVVGKTTFETVLWIGRYIQAFHGEHKTLIYRKDCKNYLCDGIQRASDANIRQAIIDKYPATGGGARPAIGIKNQPGPLYGVSSHAWSALAVGLTYQSGQYGEAVA